MWRRLAFGFVLLSAQSLPAGCSDEGPSSRIIEFCTPIHSSTHEPAVLSVVFGREPDRPEPPGTYRFLLGTEYPITTVDASAFARALGTYPSKSMELDTLDFVVVDALSVGSDDYVVGRAVFERFEALVTSLPPMGPAGGQQMYDGIFAGDLLRRYAVRLFFGLDPECQFPWTDERFPTVTFLQEFPDQDDELAQDGFAVVPFTLAGGGSYLLDGESRDFGATRIGVTACVQPAPFDPSTPDPSEVQSAADLEAAIPITGLDAFFIVATGTRPILLASSFYDRLLAADLAHHSATEGTYTLPSGTIPVLATELDRLVLVSNTSDGLPPCAELARRRRIAWIHAHRAPEEWTTGPWHITSAGPAVAEFDGSRDATGPLATLETVVVDDTQTLFQGIRFETSEDIPQVDGLLGHDFLRRFEVVLDYPNTRLVLRCARYLPPGPEGCDATAVADQGIPCCDDQGTCLCPPENPCCQLPATKLPK